MGPVAYGKTAMNKRRATRNIWTAVLLIGIILIGAAAALGSIYLVMSLPR